MTEMKKPGRVKAALLNWLGVPISLTDGTFWTEWFGSSTATGKSVTVDSALQISTVWACVRLLSETVSTLPLKVYRKLPDGSRVIASDHPLHDVLCVRPNSEMTPGRFILMIVASIAVRGNAYVEKKRLGGKLVSLIPLLPQAVAVRRNDAGALEYEIADSKGGKRKLSADDVMHIRGFGLDVFAGCCQLLSGVRSWGHPLRPMKPPRACSRRECKPAAC